MLWLKTNKALSIAWVFQNKRKLGAELIPNCINPYFFVFEPEMHPKRGPPGFSEEFSGIVGEMKGKPFDAQKKFLPDLKTLYLRNSDHYDEVSPSVSSWMRCFWDFLKGNSSLARFWFSSARMTSVTSWLGWFVLKCSRPLFLSPKHSTSLTNSSFASSTNSQLPTNSKKSRADAPWSMGFF